MSSVIYSMGRLALAIYTRLIELLANVIGTATHDLNILASKRLCSILHCESRCHLCSALNWLHQASSKSTMDQIT